LHELPVEQGELDEMPVVEEGVPEERCEGVKEWQDD
jgi:hypothetical protein